MSINLLKKVQIISNQLSLRTVDTVPQNKTRTDSERTIENLINFYQIGKKGFS